MNIEKASKICHLIVEFNIEKISNDIFEDFFLSINNKIFGAIRSKPLLSLTLLQFKSHKNMEGW